MLRRMIIAVAAVLTLLALVVVPTSAAPAPTSAPADNGILGPGPWFAWPGPDWQGPVAIVGPAAACAATPFPVQSVVHGGGGGPVLALYAAAGCPAAALIAVVPPGNAIGHLPVPAVAYTH